jgi:hypothetical protein
MPVRPWCSRLPIVLLSLTIGLAVCTSAALGNGDPESLPEWSVRVQPDGEIFSPIAGVFRRVSNRSDLGCDATLSWRDRDDGYTTQIFDDGREIITEGFERRFSVRVYPEWRRWSGIWGESLGLAIRSYWGVRLIAGVGHATDEDTARDVDERRDEVRKTKTESDDWNVGAGLSIGMSTRIWGPISFSAALSPVSFSRTHTRSIRTETFKSTAESDEVTERSSEDTDDRTDVSLSLSPRLYVVLSW